MEEGRKRHPQRVPLPTRAWDEALSTRRIPSYTANARSGLGGMAGAGSGLIAAADSSVVPNLAWLREDRLWPALFGRVPASPAVRSEFERLASMPARWRSWRGIRHVLIDEAAGRRAALALGLLPSGLLGLLVEAKKRALLPAVLPLLDRLRDDARFYLGEDLRHRIPPMPVKFSDHRVPPPPT
jgi:hypothetical protein